MHYRVPMKNKESASIWQDSCRVISFLLTIVNELALPNLFAGLFEDPFGLVKQLSNEV